MKRRCTIVLYILLLEVTACSQDQSKFGKMDLLVGTWDVTTEFRLSQDGPWETTKARSTITWELDRHVLEENYLGTRNGHPLSIKTLIAKNNLTDELQRIAMDSEHGGVMIDYTGKAEEENRFAFDKWWTYPNGNTVKLRVVYTIISVNKFTVESMRMPQDKAEWDVTGRSTYTKK